MDQLQELEVKFARLEQRMDDSDKAVAIQGKKNEDHFVILNGEQARLDRDRDRYLTKETFEEFRKAGSQKNWSAWLALLAVVAVIVSIIALFKGP